MNDNPSIAKISYNRHVRQDTLFDAHNLNHMCQIVCCFFNVVLDLHIVVHNLVLKR